MPEKFHAVRLASAKIAAAITAAAVLGLGAIAGVILWITVEFNTAAQDATRRVIDVGLKEIISSLEETTEAHARWTMMYDAVTQRRRLLLENDVGHLVYQRDIFDFVAFTDHAGRPQFAFMDHDRAVGANEFPKALLDGIVPQARDTGAPWTQTVSGIYRVGETFAIVAARAVTPTNGLRPDSPHPHFMVTGRYLDPFAVPAVQDFAADRGLELSIGDIEPQQGRNFLRLRDASGDTTGTLTWQAITPGFDVLRSSAPVIAIACIVLFLSGLFVVRASDSLRDALRREGNIARTDPLTGLPNRAGLKDFLNSEPSKAALHKGHVAILYLDLNGFKLLNDTEGHANGDAALQIVARRLSRSLRANDLAARVGGDEFVCVVLDPDPEAAVESIISRIESQSAPPITINTARYTLRPAIGHAIGRPGDIWEGLMTRADKAMYAAKSAAGDARLDIRVPPEENDPQNVDHNSPNASAA